jgi:cytochrome c biogenesis factor
MARIGAAALWCALLMSLAAIPLLVLATRRGAARGAFARAGRLAYLASGVATLTAVASLWSALLASDFSFRYVALHSSALFSRQPAITALWAGSEGTLLWCAAMLAGSGIVAALVHWRRATLTPVALAVLAAVSAVLLLTLCVGANPFVRLANAPQEGRAFPPLLLHTGMLLQPPLMLLGLALSVVPFAFTGAQLMHALGSPALTRRRDGERDEAPANGDDAWRGIVQRWLVVAWVVLTIAFGIGLWWAQQQLGWFGYFFTWEPYASAPVLPWLAITAMLVVLVSGADRASGALWLAAFVAFGALLSAFALVRVREGIAASIRAVAAAPAVSLLVLGTVGVAMVGATALAAMRRATPSDGSDVNASGAMVRARMGGMLTLIGVLLVAVGFGASHWRRDLTTGVDIGQVVDATDAFGGAWRFTSQGLSSYQEPAYTVMAVVVNATVNGKRAGLLNSQQRQYYDATDNEIFEPTTRVGSLVRWNQTVTLGFLGAIDRTSAAVRVSFVPLVFALWLGLTLCVLGMACAAWPVEALPRSRTAVIVTPAACPACDVPLADGDARYCTRCGTALR